LTIHEKIYASKTSECYQDDTGPPLQENEKIRGGMSILQQQALCPFKAFAEWRLHVNPIEQPLPGLRAKDRGTVLHAAIEKIWEQLKTHANLMAIPAHDLQHIIDQSILSALSNVQHIYQSDSQYLGLEKQRLKQLLTDWLDLEKTRPPFTVLNHEKTIQMSLNQLKLTLRIDRIDELANGHKLIIDYKTGKRNDINHWFSERPEQPQLPLYSLLDDKTIGIAFAQIFPGESYFKGVSHYDLQIKGIKLLSELSKANASNWQEQVADWRAVLTQLSDDFCAGKAAVDPKNHPETCTWCQLQAFCRIHEDATHAAN
jgi:ATP-dependent helicase/nuclease subunit B